MAINKNETLPEKPKKDEKNIIVNDIQFRSVNRSRKDIGDWKHALITAESVYHPNRTRLYDTYADILLDGHLSGIIRKRIDSVLNKRLHFEDKDGNRVEELDVLAGSVNFRQLCEVILQTQLWGLSGVEFVPGKEFEFYPIPRKHIKPKWGVISYEQNGTEGFEYEDNPNLWIMGQPKDLGILLKCAPYALLKRGSLADWAQFIEIFGQPVRIIKYDAYDRQAKVELKEVLDASGSSLAMLIPNTADFEMLDGKTSNANGDLQNKFVANLNDEMSITILGNTETTGNNNGGSNAKANTQRDDQMELIKSDMKYLLGYLNSKSFLTILQSYGFASGKGEFVFEKEANVDFITKQLDIAEKSKQMGVPVEDDYIYDLTGIPKPGNYEQMKKQAEEEKERQRQMQPSFAPPNQIDQSYWDKLREKLADFFDPAP